MVCDRPNSREAFVSKNLTGASIAHNFDHISWRAQPSPLGRVIEGRREGKAWRGGQQEGRPEGGGGWGQGGHSIIFAQHLGSCKSFYKFSWPEQSKIRGYPCFLLAAFQKFRRFFWHPYCHIYDCHSLHMSYVSFDIYWIYDTYDKLTYAIWQMYIRPYGCQKNRLDLRNAAIYPKMH